MVHPFRGVTEEPPEESSPVATRPAVALAAGLATAEALMVPAAGEALMVPVAVVVPGGRRRWRAPAGRCA